jgi:Type IV pilin-like G and H, putative
MIAVKSGHTDCKRILCQSLNAMSNKSKNIIGGFIFIFLGIMFVGNLLSTPAKNSHHQEISEAEQNIHIANKLQSIFIMENSKFATTFDELAIGVPMGGVTATTSNFEYKLEIRSQDLAIIGAKPLDREMSGFNGAVLRSKNAKGAVVTFSIICRSQIPGADGTNSARAPIADTAGQLRCADGWNNNALALKPNK